MHQILFVDDEPSYQKGFVRSLKSYPGIRIDTCSNGKEALRFLEKNHVDLVVTDVMMPCMDGMILLQHIKERYPHIFVVVITGLSSVPQAVSAMKLGAYDYLTKPFDMDEVRRILDTVISHRAFLTRQAPRSSERRKGERFENIIGQDRTMFSLFETISQVAETDASVLIMGESGTGKERVAEAIHYRSLRRGKPFIKVNCAALTESLINSELFGHEKGAFTGANALKKGYFEMANRGTIFLDEIGDISPKTQVALLRVLDLGHFQRVGSTRTIKVDIRLICATHQNLRQAMEERRFREDLYYRLNVVSITIPPLRDRKSDITLLAEAFTRSRETSGVKERKILSPGALHILRNYSWPGNVRELYNTIQHALIFAKTPLVQPEDLPETIRTRSDNDFSLTISSPSLAQAERKLIQKVLSDTHWNYSMAAQRLEIARGTLYSKINKLAIPKPGKTEVNEGQ